MVETRKIAPTKAKVAAKPMPRQETFAPPPPPPPVTVPAPVGGTPRADVFDPIGKAKETVASASNQSVEALKQAAAAGKPPPPPENPYDYESYTYNYKPQLQAAPERQYAPSLGFQRYQSDAGVNAGAQSGYLTGASNLASTSGLSLADRKALQQQSQRARVMGGQGAQSQYNQMQAQNLYDTEQFNTQNTQKVAAANQGIMNQYEAEKAEFERKKAEVIYEQKKADARLQQALEAASNTAY